MVAYPHCPVLSAADPLGTSAGMTSLNARRSKTLRLEVLCVNELLRICNQDTNICSVQIRDLQYH